MNRRQFLASTIFLPMILRGRFLQQVTIPTGFGVGIPWQPADTDPTWYHRVYGALTPDWWHNWKFDQIAHPHNVPMFWRPEHGPLFDQAVAAANRYPNKLWLLFHAPERQQQTNSNPQVAAQIAQDWQASTHDQFSVGGVFFGQRGIDWLSGYLDAGGPVPAAWHFHIYGLRDADELAILLDDPFQSWYEDEGMGRPVIISEVTGERSYTPDEQEAVMSAIASAISTPPIVGAGWFSAYDPSERWTTADLVTASGAVTPLGEFYQDLTE